MQNVNQYFSKDFILDVYSRVEHYKRIPSFLNYLKPGARILDIGCSSGGFDKLLSEKGVEILGIDISKKAILKARKINKDYKRVRFLVRDISKWKSNERFDCILGLFNLLGFIPLTKERIQVLENMLFMLKDNGKIYLTFTAFDIKILIKAMYYYVKNKLQMRHVEFWDTWDYHPRVDIPIFKHNLFPYELKRLLKTVKVRYDFNYKFKSLDKTNYLLVIIKT